MQWNADVDHELIWFTCYKYKIWLTRGVGLIIQENISELPTIENERSRRNSFYMLFVDKTFVLPFYIDSIS